MFLSTIDRSSSILSIMPFTADSYVHVFLS